MFVYVMNRVDIGCFSQLLTTLFLGTGYKLNLEFSWTSWPPNTRNPISAFSVMGITGTW